MDSARVAIWTSGDSVTPRTAAVNLIRQTLRLPLLLAKAHEAAERQHPAEGPVDGLGRSVHAAVGEPVESPHDDQQQPEQPQRDAPEREDDDEEDDRERQQQQRGDREEAEMGGFDDHRMYFQLRGFPSISH